MSKTEESRSRSDPEGTREPRRRLFQRDEWRELNAVQLVCIATGTVAAMFGLFGGLLVLLSAIAGDRGIAGEPVMYTASIPSLVALACCVGAVVFTRSRAARRAARQECGPAVLLALSGLLGIAIGWVIG